MLPRALNKTTGGVSGSTRGTNSTIGCVPLSLTGNTPGGSRLLVFGFPLQTVKIVAI